jgi:hypothetical protein
MAWTPLTFVSCGVLTAGMMTQLQDNFSALAGGSPGAPPLAVNSLVWSGVASGAELSVSSRAALRALTASDVSSLAFLQVSSQWNGRNALVTEQLSAAGVNVSSLGVIRSLAVSETASVGMLSISGVPPASPIANTLYKHPTAGANGFAVPMDPASALQSLAPVLTAAQGGIAAGTLEGWHVIGAASEPAFLNGTSALGAPWLSPRFRKLPSGVVQIVVNAKNGGNNVVVFTLPAGYRPSATVLIGGSGAGNVAGNIFITSGGAVTMGLSAGTVVLACGTFFAEQ